MIDVRRLAIAAVVAAILGMAQASGQPEPGGLFKLVTGSQFCAVVTVRELAPVGRRLTKGELESLTDLSVTLGGARYRLRIDEFLCRSTDVAAKDSSSAGTELPKEIDIFKRRDSSFFRGRGYVAGEQYLVFARVLPDQSDLATEYQLEPDRLYYREVDGGLFPLAGDDSSVLKMTRAFCEAVRPSDPAGKLKRLRRILLSKHLDEDFKESVLKAIAVIERK